MTNEDPRPTATDIPPGAAREELRAAADTVLARHGYVDILVHNAGIASRGLTVAETEPAEVERVIGTHALGAHRLTARLLPAMRAARMDPVEALRHE